jgi:hypothetical protein
MTTLPLTQRLYDITRTDLSEFRSSLADWHINQTQSGFAYGGTAIDLFWQMSRKHLESKIAQYFEWIEKESASISPSALRRQAIQQCGGAVVSYFKQVQNITINKHRTMARLSTAVDFGNWCNVDDQLIVRRINLLLEGYGLQWTASLFWRLNHFVSDHKWLPLVSMFLSIASVVIAIAAYLKR